METALELTFVDKTAQKLGAEVRNKQNKKKKKKKQQKRVMRISEGLSEGGRNYNFFWLLFQNTHTHIYIYKSDG